MLHLRAWGTTFDSYQACAQLQKFNHGGGGSDIEGESLSCQLHFQSARKTKKNASAQGSLKFREVSNSFWEGTRREETRLKKVTYLLTIDS